MKGLEEIKKLFNTNKNGDTICFSLVCWTDGFWSVNVTDSWHKWSDKKIPQYNYRHSSPEIAIKEFLKYVKDNNIDCKELQENDELWG